MNLNAIGADELARVLESIGKALIATDVKGSVKLMNPVAERLTGWKATEAHDRPISDVFCPVQEETGAPVDDAVARVLHDGKVIGPANERVLIARDGTRFPITESAAPIRGEDDSVHGVMLIFSDQTERYVARQKLRESEAHLRTLVQSLPDPVWLKDPDGVYLACNATFERLYGAKATDICGKTDFDFVDKQTAESFRQQDRRAIAAGKPTINEEWLTFAADGYQGHFETIKTPMVDGHGVLVGVLGTARDITERKRMQDELRDAHIQLEEMLAHSPAVTFRLGIENERVIPISASANIVRLLGFEREETLRFEWWQKQVHPDDLDRALLSIPEAIHEGVSRVEYRLRHKDGNYRWVEDTKRLIEGNSTRQCEVVGVWLDITERRQAERRAAEAVTYNQTILEHSPVGIISYDLNGNGVSANAAAARILGTSIDQLKAQNFREIPSWHCSGLLAAAEQTLQTGKEQALEVHIVTTFGKEVWLACYLAPFFHEGQSQLVLMFSDISENKRAHERLRLQSSALEAAANAIVITGQDGAIEWVNAAFTTVTGYTAAEAIGSNPRDLLKSGKHDPAFYHNLWKTILAGEVWRGEIINRRKDGSLYPEDMTITPVKNAHGAVTHFIAVKQDVTKGKALEEQLRQSQKMEAVGQLAGGVAHDFNNMLAVIQGHACLMQMGLQPDEQQNSLQEIVKAGERAANLTRQLLAFSRRQVMQAKDIDLNDLVSGTVKMLRRIIGEDIDLQTRFSGEKSYVHCDPGMIEQILLNLAVNARDAMPDGGQIDITLTNITLDDVTARSQNRSGDFVRLSFHDSGSGIAPEILSHIFEPFFTTKDVGKGTGLGLATVHGIVTQHRGWIEVQSELGRGTTFFVHLPRLADSQQSVAAASGDVSVRGGHETILLVEDDLALRSLAIQVLKRYGYNVLEAANGVMALDLWREHPEKIDLLLTDIIMPESVSGRQLAERLRAERPALKVIFMSGYPGEVSGRGLDLREGVNFLQKPFASIKIAQAVRDILDAK